MNDFEQKISGISSIDPNLLIEKSNARPQEQKMVLYQLFVRLFGNKNSNINLYGTLEENGCGKFNDINYKALDALKQLGITYIWYTGVIEHAVIGNYKAYGIPQDDPDVVKGRAGSPYAIKDYYDVNPDLSEDIPSRLQEFEALLQRTHDKNMKAIIDFVPNHVARNYISDTKPEEIEDLGASDDTSVRFHPQNNFYYIPDHPFQVPEGYAPLGGTNDLAGKDGEYFEFPAKATGNNVFKANPGLHDWFETVKLNYGIDYEHDESKHFTPIPDTWHKMLQILLFWAGKGVDGFRCDMAEMVPVEFWEWVIPNIKSCFPEIIFIAEIYQPDQYHNYIEKSQFDYLYDKVQLYDTLREITIQKSNADKISSIWQSLRGYNHRMLRFLENHDEQRIASRHFADDPFKALPAMTVTATIYTGPVIIYNGQEVGEASDEASGFSGEDGRSTIFDYWHMPQHQKWMNRGLFDGGILSPRQKELRKFYDQLLNLCQEPAIKNGYFYDLHPHNRMLSYGYTDQTFAFLRFTENQRLLVIVNFNLHNMVNCNLKIPLTAIQAMGLHENKVYNARDILLSDQQSSFNTEKIIVNEVEEGLLLGLEPLGCYIFNITDN